jgi:hypothetical protein
MDKTKHKDVALTLEHRGTQFWKIGGTSNPTINKTHTNRLKRTRRGIMHATRINF